MDMNDYFKENKEFKDAYKRMMKQMSENLDNKYQDFKQEECLIIVLTNGDSFDYPLEIRNDTHKEDIIEKITSGIDENMVFEIHNNEGVFYINSRNIAYFYFKSTDSSFNEYKRNLLNYMKDMDSDSSVGGYGRN